MVKVETFRILFLFSFAQTSISLLKWSYSSNAFCIWPQKAVICIKNLSLKRVFLGGKFPSKKSCPKIYGIRYGSKDILLLKNNTSRSFALICFLQYYYWKL